MTIKGSVKGGKVVRPEGVTFPEGTEVESEVTTPSLNPATATTELGRTLLELAGSCEGLPEDLSVNLDHSLYGTPKR